MDSTPASCSGPLARKPIDRIRLLNLGLAFPPGVSGLFPELQPAGHAIETSMIESIRSRFDIRSVGISGLCVESLLRSSRAQSSDGTRTTEQAAYRESLVVPLARTSPGLPHSLNLKDKPPEIWHRYSSLSQLKKTYLSWQTEGWHPEAIMVCNLLSPVYTAFVRWLRPAGRARLVSASDGPGSLGPGRQPWNGRDRPSDSALILYLADSTQLGLEMPWLRRLRYRFKPLVYPEADMLPYFDACVATSRTTEKLFAPRNIPWLWLPNGCESSRALSPAEGPAEGPIQFGYFGSLPPYTGLPALMRIFTTGDHSSTLHICGFGKMKAEIAAACRKDARLRFYGPRTPDECLQFALNCDVLVNPRPLWPGNGNNFSSKVFEYAVSGRAILTSKVSGIDLILGDQAYYFDEGDFERSLDRKLAELRGTPRAELKRRGEAVQRRLLREYSWAQQGQRLGDFLSRVALGRSESIGA